MKELPIICHMPNARFLKKESAPDSVPATAEETGPTPEMVESLRSLRMALREDMAKLTQEIAQESDSEIVAKIQDSLMNADVTTDVPMGEPKDITETLEPDVIPPAGFQKLDFDLTAPPALGEIPIGEPADLDDNLEPDTF